jgi:hypothetical protein
MENKKFSFHKLLDRLLAIGGTGVGAALLGACLSSGHVPPQAVLMTFVSFGVGALGGFRLQKRHYEALLAKAQGTTPSAPGLPADSTPDLEVRLLDMLALKKGQFSLVEAVVMLREPIDRVLPVLEKLRKQGVLGTEVSDAGEILYTSSAFQLGSPRLA